MCNCLGFIKEETLLRTNAHNMGERIDHSIINHKPKCHPDIFGEDAEYSCITEKFHWIRIKVRKTPKSVQKAISIYNLTTTWVFMFSRRAQEYVIS